MKSFVEGQSEVCFLLLFVPLCSVLTVAVDGSVSTLQLHNSEAVGGNSEVDVNQNKYKIYFQGLYNCNIHDQVRKKFLIQIEYQLLFVCSKSYVRIRFHVISVVTLAVTRLADRYQCFGGATASILSMKMKE
jgi:hypothetical protein